MLSQRDAVLKAITNVQNKEIEGKVELTKDEKAQVIEIIVAGFQNNEISLKKTYESEKKLRAYTKGMVNDALRKDKRLNGGIKYEYANPGSRVGSSNPVVKELRKLKSTLTEANDIELVDAQIEAQLDIIKQEREAKKAAKVKEVKINIDNIPEELLHLVK